jgi:hypothetical protein
MRLGEAQSRQSAEAWSAEEELTIADIQQAESVPRAEAIRLMQRRKKALQPVAQRRSVPTNQRLCRNPRCTRGDDGGPGSLAHLRADARYCGATCKKPSREVLDSRIRPPIASIYAGLNGDNPAFYGRPTIPGSTSPQNARNREVVSKRRGRPQFVATGDDREATCPN